MTERTRITFPPDNGKSELNFVTTAKDVEVDNKSFSYFHGVQYSNDTGLTIHTVHNTADYRAPGLGQLTISETFSGDKRPSVEYRYLYFVGQNPNSKREFVKNAALDAWFEVIGDKVQREPLSADQVPGMKEARNTIASLSFASDNSRKEVAAAAISAVNTQIDIGVVEGSRIKPPANLSRA